jgi:hypothetical protein
MTARAAELRSAFEAAEDDMRRATAVPEPFRDEAAVTAGVCPVGSSPRGIAGGTG